jgi:hypothetical protein
MTDAKLQELYIRYMDFTTKVAESDPEYTAFAIAGVMLAQAMKVYRTVLSEEDYQEMALKIYESRNNVPKFEVPTVQ